MMKQKQDVVLTGDRPTGKLHLGHFVGSIQNRVKLQNEHTRCFYMIADVQALTDNADNPEKVHKNVLEVALDNIAAGVNPKKNTFFIQSQIPENPQLTILFFNLFTFSQFQKKPHI